MRCKNCGWQNPDGVTVCERCGSALDDSPSSGMDRKSVSGGTQRESASSPLRSTLREGVAFGADDNPSYRPSFSHQEAQGSNSPTECPNCGYMVSPGMNVCPQCGTPLKQQQAGQSKHNPSQKREKHCPNCGATVSATAKFCPTCGKPLGMRGTVNAWDNPQHDEFCSLKPIAWARENIQYNPISFSGERIVLNRANTDPNNQSITSREQAVLTHEGDSWYIEDHSDQHSTMIRVSRKMKLENGDIIALGNRLFEFQN